MDDATLHGSRFAASKRAGAYRAQADAFRRLADLEPLAQKRRLLELSASKYDEVAKREEGVAFGQRREER